MTSFLNNVQFKWGRTELFTSTTTAEYGEHVMVESENKGFDLGAVISCKELDPTDESSKNLKKIFRFATSEESEYWEGEVVKREVSARITANTILPENSTNIRVIHASYTFDATMLYLHYEPSGGSINLSPYMSDLRKAFPESEVRMTMLESKKEEKTTPPPMPFPRQAPPTASNFGYKYPNMYAKQAMARQYHQADQLDYECDMAFMRMVCNRGHRRVMSSDSSHSNWSDSDYDMIEMVSPAFYSPRVPPPTACY